MTSYGNSMNNIWMTETVLRMAGIDKKLIGAIILGDDNLACFKGKLDISVDSLVELYASIGFRAKIKLSNHIANVSFCSMIFAPIKNILTFDDEYSLTLIASPMRLLLKFCKVRATSLASYKGDIK
jgi:hypothetical protein